MICEFCSCESTDIHKRLFHFGTQPLRREWDSKWGPMRGRRHLGATKLVHVRMTFLGASKATEGIVLTEVRIGKRGLRWVREGKEPRYFTIIGLKLSLDNGKRQQEKQGREGVESV